jgi:AbiJ N-terminal domain 4
VRFSERHGYKTARDTIQIDSMDTGLRTSLWNVLKIHAWDSVNRASTTTLKYHSQMHTFCKKLWFHYFKKPLDTLDHDWDVVLAELRAYFFACQWFEVYDFIEFTADNFPYTGYEEYVRGCNIVLEQEVSAYRFVDLVITRVTDETEIAAIDTALAGPKDPVRTHLRRALELFSDRPSPDYRNSIKESISAVESLVSTVVGKKGTLGQLAKQIGVHPALHKAFGNLYGYTSDEDGIRHAILEPGNSVGFEDAKFFLVVCSAFVSFVESKVASVQTDGTS